MKRGRIQTLEDMMALPEGEWFEVPDGVDVEVVFDDKITVEADRIVVPLPPGVARRFHGRGSARLEARVDGNRLIIERRGREGSKRPRKRARVA